MTLRTRSLLGPTLVATVALLGTLTACASDGSGTSAPMHQVKAGDDSCKVDDTSLNAGPHAFRIENVGSDVTEVYVYGKDGDGFSKIIGEKENIGPGTAQTLEVDLAAGDYQVACKPNMTGDGIRAGVTVTGSGASTEATEGTYDRELEFAVTTSEKVRRPTRLDATTGEKIEFKLDNRAGAEYYLELLSPDGTELGQAEAHAGEEAEFVTELPDSGKYEVKIFRDGQEDDANTITLTVAK